MDEEKYPGLIGKTRIGTTVYTCDCGTRFGTKIFLSLNTAERPDLVERAVSGKLNASICPGCKQESEIPVQYIYHDPEQKYFVLVIPKLQRHLEIVLRANLLREIAENPSEVIPDYVVNFSSVFGSEGLGAFLKAPPADPRTARMQAEELRKTEAALKEKEIALQSKEAGLAQAEAGIAQKETDLAQKEQTLVSREQKLRERGQKITEMEDIIHDKTDELDQKMQELSVFEGQLKQWEARLAQRQQSFEDFSRTLEEQKKSNAANEAEKPRDQREEVPSWFADKEPDREKDEAHSPSLSSSIKKILPEKQEKPGKAEKKKVFEVSDSDVIEEADIINEGDIIDEKPIVPIPLKEARNESRALHPDARKLAAMDEKVVRDLQSPRRKSVSIRNDRVLLWVITAREDLHKEASPALARLRVHLVRSSGGFPWIALSLSIRPPKTGTFFTAWFLNYKDPESYRIIKYLEKKFEADVNLVADERDKISTLKLGAPLVSNLKKIIDDTERALAEDKSLQPDKELDEEGLTQSLREELKAPFPFHSKYYPEDPSAKKILDIIQELSKWSSPPLGDRIAHTFSYPLEEMAVLKTRAIKGAIGYGIYVPEVLWQEAPALGLASSKRDILLSQIKLFARLCKSAGDLSTEEKKANWESLLGEARKISLRIEPAEAVVAMNFVGESCFDPETLDEVNKSLEVDIKKVGVDKLQELLSIRKKRTEALLEIIGRGEKSLFENAIQAVLDMEAAELNDILWVITGTEDLGETLLLRGLESGRRPVRLACAAFLGKQKLRSAIVPLIKLMIESEEPDWKFIAWLITHFGISGVRAVEQFIKDPRGHEIKIIYLLAALIVTGQGKQVEKYADDTNLLVRSMTKKALEIAREIATEEEEIRKVITKDFGIKLP